MLILKASALQMGWTEAISALMLLSILTQVRHMTLYTELALYYNFAAPSIIFTIVIIAFSITWSDTNS
jgi:hypothetical protein